MIWCTNTQVSQPLIISGEGATMGGDDNDNDDNQRDDEDARIDSQRSSSGFLIRFLEK